MELPNESVKNGLIDVIKDQGFVNYKIELSPGSKKGDNYGGVVYKAAVTGNKISGEESTLNLFVKVPPLGDTMRKNFALGEAYLREIKVYNEILKEFKQLEEERGVKDGFTSYAKCFNSGTTVLEEFLIMEDLSQQDYAMFDRMKVIDLEHTKLVMKALGQMHAFSFALRDQRPDVFTKYSYELTELFLGDDMYESTRSFLTQIISSVVEKLKLVGKYQEKWENFHKNYLSIIKSCVIEKLAEPYAVVSHGDFWNNNMMFKYQNGKPTKVCLLDWQLCRYASPALDLVHYLFGSVEKPLRDLHYQTLLDTYYESLSNLLKQLGSDPEKLYSYAAFQNQLKEFGKFGLALGVIIIPNIVNSPEDALSYEEILQDASSVTDNEKNLSTWVKRLTDVVTDMVDLGYL